MRLVTGFNPVKTDSKWPEGKDNKKIVLNPPLVYARILTISIPVFLRVLYGAPTPFEQLLPCWGSLNGFGLPNHYTGPS